MFDALFSLMAQHVPYTQITGHSPIRYGALHPNLIPTGSFKTKDGHIVLTAFNTGFWKRICAVLGKEEWLADSRFTTHSDRSKNREIVYREMKSQFLQKTTAEWEKILQAYDIPHGPVRFIHELLNDPNVEARGLLAEMGIGPLKAPIGAVKYSAFKQEVRKAPPKLGEDTAHVLRTILGKTEKQIEDIMKKIAD